MVKEYKEMLEEKTREQNIRFSKLEKGQENLEQEQNVRFSKLEKGQENLQGLILDLIKKK